MDKYTVANIVNDNINKVLSVLNNESYVDNGVYEIIRGYTVKETIIPLSKRRVENDQNNK